MSKLARKPIIVPKDVTVHISGHTVSVKGLHGNLEWRLPDGITVVVGDSGVMVSMVETALARNTALLGLSRSTIDNMVRGVAQPFSKVLEFEGVGYKASVKGVDLELHLGYSHPITVTAPSGITFTVVKSSITISGVDKELVGQVAAVIRSKRPPEPFKGSGIRYRDEIIRRKAGKKAVVAGGGAA